MAKWIQHLKKADFKAISKKYNIDQVVARIIRNRDIISDDEYEMFLNGDMSFLRNPSNMKDMDKAALIIKDYIEKSKKIRIIGDYDVDGICSTYVLLRGLSQIGAMVDTVIPHRIKDGYGLNDSLIEDAYKDEIDLILTCDNGIAAYDQIKKANEYGMAVIVTDHHEVPYNMVDKAKEYILPPALAIVDPKQEDCNYPFKGICGAFVAYKLIETLFADRYSEVLDELISFAALATICDVMELKDENRIIVKNALSKMNRTANNGLKALLYVNNLMDVELNTYHVGFIIGPCLNASGRLDTARKALDLFNAKDYKEAVEIAISLKELNESRKKMTEDGTKEAIFQIESSELVKDRVLVVYLQNTHESLAGIIAGRIKEKYNKPTFVITDAEDGLKGSGRSIESYDMYEAISEVKDLLSKFGGHKMAAGISLDSVDKLNDLRKRLNENCFLTEDDMQKKVMIDVPMPLSYINKSLIRSFSILEPYGTGNPKPVFATKKISLISYNKIGKNKNVGKFRIVDDLLNEFEMIYFGALDEFDEFVIKNYGNDKYILLRDAMCHRGDIMINIVYYPEINSFRNVENIQIVMNDYGVYRDDSNSNT